MNYTNKHKLPQSLVDVILNNTRDLTQSNPTRISVTSLINPPIISQLQKRHWNELTEDVSDHIWRITGNAYHYVLANTKDINRLIEEKLQMVVDDITIVGKLDLYDDETKSVEDYKVTSVWSVKEGDKKEWEWQLNCYCWLLRKTGFPIEKAFINAILRDWRKAELKRYNDYPPIPFKRIEIKLWTFEEQEKFIKERVALYKSVLSLTDKDLPICSPEDRWKVEDTYAIYKANNKTATRVLNSEQEARDYIQANNIPSPRIEKRPGTDNKCAEYCIVNKFCPYYQTVYGGKNERKKS